MHLRPIAEMPVDHRHFRGRFLGETEDGLEFSLEVSQVRRRRNSHELIRAQMDSRARGRPLSPDSVYKDVVEIALFIKRLRRFDIEITPSGMYRYGRHAERTLPEIVTKVIGEYVPRPEAGGPKP